MPEIRLVTRRLTLRPAAMGDADALFPLIANWNVARWLGVVPWPYAMDDMRYFLREVAAPRAASSFPVFAICLGDAPIGCAEWRGPASASGESGGPATELGYWLGEPYWGRGYATEANSALIAYAFRETDAEAILSGVFQGNSGSLRVQEKLGFEVTATVMQMCRPRGEELPLIRTRLARERFRPVV